MTDAEGPPRLELPGSPLTIGQPEPKFPVSHREWRRLRERVAALSNPLPYATGVMWTCIGIAGSAFLSLAPWLAAYSQLPTDSQLAFSWISPTLFVSGVASLVVAVLAFLMERSTQQHMKVDAQQVLQDMDEMYSLYRSE